MSSKSTILLTPFCHIYHDCIGSNGDETLCIEVSYDDVECGGVAQDFIEVKWDSEFSRLVQALLKGKDLGWISAAVDGFFK